VDFGLNEGSSILKSLLKGFFSSKKLISIKVRATLHSKILWVTIGPHSVTVVVYWATSFWRYGLLLIGWSKFYLFNCSQWFAVINYLWFWNWLFSIAVFEACEAFGNILIIKYINTFHFFPNLQRFNQAQRWKSQKPDTRYVQ
jgi:hypothetical protein